MGEYMTEDRHPWRLEMSTLLLVSCIDDDDNDNT